MLGTKDVNGLEMMIITSGTDDIVVEMQYKSPLNGKIRRCTMTVSRDYKEPYLDARKFVVNVLNSRGPAFGHEPVTVAAASLTNRRSTGLLHEIINFLLGKSTKN